MANLKTKTEFCGVGGKLDVTIKMWYPLKNNMES